MKTSRPASKTRVILMWLVFLGAVIFWVALFTVHFLRNDPGEGTPPPGLAHGVFMFVGGGFCLALGIAGYFAVIGTTCLTFNFQRPIWKDLKVRLYFANIFVPLAFALAFGFMASAFLAPMLSRFGLSPGLAGFLPVMVMIGLLQMVQLWFLIWAPVEKRAIARRLAARGITPAQLQAAFFVGLSNPTVSSLKKFGLIEEDIGALWAGSDLLIYWGDNEHFALRPEDVLELERKADSGSTTILGGIAHVILHVHTSDGTPRQIRLHAEGVWTMGQKRVAMDELASAITTWHSTRETRFQPAATDPAQPPPLPV